MTTDLKKLEPTQLAGWVPVLVPEQDYVAVCQFVAARQAERAPSGKRSSGVEGEANGTGTDPRLTTWPAWPEDALQRLAQSSTATTQRWAAAMDAIAQGEQDWYTTSEVAQLSGLTVNEWRDAPRKISRHLKAHYTDVPVHKGNLAWPLRPWTNPDRPAEVSWGMPPVTKQRWLQIRGLDR